jgi:hypothetical protein
LDVNYRINVPLVKSLKIIGGAGKDCDSRAKGWSGIYNQEGELPSEAKVLVIDMPNSPDPSELQELDWKVFPDFPEDLVLPRNQVSFIVVRHHPRADSRMGIIRRRPS